MRLLPSDFARSHTLLVKALAYPRPFLRLGIFRTFPNRRANRAAELGRLVVRQFRQAYFPRTSGLPGRVASSGVECKNDIG